MENQNQQKIQQDFQNLQPLKEVGMESESKESQQEGHKTTAEKETTRELQSQVGKRVDKEGKGVAEPRLQQGKRANQNQGLVGSTLTGQAKSSTKKWLAAAGIPAASGTAGFLTSWFLT